MTDPRFAIRLEGDRRRPEPEAGDGVRVEFVGGPRNGDRDRLTDRPDRIAAIGGAYHRSVSCADDGALRYVFEAEAI